jgi:hypothetical protein
VVSRGLKLTLKDGVPDVSEYPSGQHDFEKMVQMAVARWLDGQEEVQEDA